ncbi:MAG TPA: SUMF1/EgtB/PvdO family nonheme iron enzyme, partial [Candidatus Hydrogenedentes bacterium]|nr:SUMF1/EgtB/PvdO family nonheme iron enzyme [Candidatus Hydrogenedentota bacterium]
GWHLVSVVDSEEGTKPGSYTTTAVTANRTVTATFEEDATAPPAVTSFAINSGAATTMTLAVTLDNTTTNSPTDYMASESASFTGASWTAYSAAPSFTLSFGVGTRTVHFKARNAGGESGVVTDTIFVVPNTVSVAAGTFTMGRPYAWDASWGGERTNELPTHSVELGAYQVGRGKVTNKEYCDVLNWAKAQGYLYSDTAGTAWPGSGNIYAGNASGARYLIVSFASSDIQYSGGVFTSKARTGLAPGSGTTSYSMDTHPMVYVSWYGSVAFCNWLSQMQGLTPCYDMATALWPLTVAPPASGGYRLPTEAEWERTAAWDGAKHWVYGFTSDTLSGRDRCNYYWWNGSSHVDYNNPLGLTTMPYTSPVGWFDGAHVSPNPQPSGIATVNSLSPVGAYDMSGNVWEWCGDWYLSTYYSGGAMTNPTGPATGSSRVTRGGGWLNDFSICRSAYRNNLTPTTTLNRIGFRLARS